MSSPGGTLNSLSRQSKLPLYQQLYDILRSELMRGVWKPGELVTLRDAQANVIVTYMVPTP